MGACMSQGSSENKTKDNNEKMASKKIEEQNMEEQIAEQAIKKLLLLGAGESGKSTLFKQMITLYGKGYSEEDRKSYTHIVYNNTISAMKILVKYSEELDAELDTRVRPEAVTAKTFIDQCKTEIDIDPAVAEHIKMLWADKGIQNAYDNRAKFQLPDSAQYFFDRISVVSQPNYIPDEQDVLRSRVRTTGIVETEFIIESNRFKMFDVGGQRNERKKWIHCFENVTAVIFVAAMSEYDQVLYEDETTNRMTEALNLFDEICNSRWFRETSMILFLNKRDLFAEKIKKVQLSVCFPEFTGTNDFETASAFLEEMFRGKNQTPEKEVYSHVTCATDTNNIAHVFNAVKDIIIRKSLREGGLM
uniref:Uncharacterized protein n=1 Tax=Spongospora subterranea TaxID=70186 RepID=A0A0H5R152_9EUKA|eukprot:CRZ01524.1 hypothetical protein [Spongospora subterranea]